MSELTPKTLINSDLSSLNFSDLSATFFSDEQNVPKSGEKFIVFFLDKEYYAVSARQVAEVVNPQTVTPLPKVPEWLLGIFNFRGEIVSVVDLQKFWAGNSNPSDSSKPKFIVLRAGHADSLIAFTVDKVSEIVTLKADEIRSVEEVEAPYLMAKIKYKSTTLHLLDAEKLFSSLVINA